MKNSTMKNIIFTMFLSVALNINASEYVYKDIYLDIPDCEVTGGGIANLPPYDVLWFSGKNWDMGFGDAGFKEKCQFISENIDNTISCEEKDRIQMINALITENSKATQVLFSNLLNEEIKRQEFKNYILYSSVGKDKYSIAILVKKETGKTTEIKGKFGDKHLKWLRLEPL